MKELILYGIIAYFLYSIFNKKSSENINDKNEEGATLLNSYGKKPGLALKPVNRVAQFDIVHRRHSAVDQKGMGEYFDKTRGQYHRQHGW